MSKLLSTDEVQEIVKEIHNLVVLGVIQHYVPSIPEGEKFVIWLDGQALLMDQDTVTFFLAGITASRDFMARQVGMRR